MAVLAQHPAAAFVLEEDEDESEEQDSVAESVHTSSVAEYSFVSSVDVLLPLSPSDLVNADLA